VPVIAAKAARLMIRVNIMFSPSRYQFKLDERMRFGPCCKASRH
jgi:hypothetical protein